VTVAVVVPPAAAHAASDPLAAAVARVSEAERADHRAAQRYDSAQAHYYDLRDQQAIE